MGSILGWGRSHGGGNGNPSQYSCLENLMDSWWTTALGITKSWTWPSAHRSVNQADIHLMESLDLRELWVFWVVGWHDPTCLSVAVFSCIQSKTLLSLEETLSRDLLWLPPGKFERFNCPNLQRGSIPGSFPAGWPRRTLPTYSLAPYASAPLARAALHTLPRLFRFPDMALLGISNWVALSNYDCWIWSSNLYNDLH